MDVDARVLVPDSQPAPAGGNNPAPASTPSGTGPSQYFNALRACYSTLGSLSEILADIGAQEDARIEAHPGAAPYDAESWWTPFVSQLNTTIAMANMIAGRYGYQRAGPQSIPCNREHFPVCMREHNPVCTREHNPKCTRPHADGKQAAAPAAAANKTSYAAKVAVPASDKADRAPQGPQVPAKFLDARAKTHVFDNAATAVAASNYMRLVPGTTPEKAVAAVTADAPKRAVAPKAKSAPKGANKKIYVKFEMNEDERAKLPSAAELADDLAARVGSSEESQAADIDAWCPRSLHGGGCLKRHADRPHDHGFKYAQLDHVEVGKMGISFFFQNSIPRDPCHPSYEYHTQLCADVAQVAVDAACDTLGARVIPTMFTFTNSVVFRSVPVADTDGNEYTTSNIMNQCNANGIWGDVIIERVNFYKRADEDKIMDVFVTFVDDARDTAFRRITRGSTRIADTYCRAQEVKQSARPAPAPRCNKCQRWGHTTARCNSRFDNCGICAGPHPEHLHARVAAGALVKCFNCGKDHRADSTACKFFEKRADAEWRKANAPVWDKAKRTWIYYSSRAAPAARMSATA